MSKVIIIAEAGVNHNGSMDNAKRLIEKAHEAGADYVKFQFFNSKKLVSKYAAKAEYQEKTTGSSESQFEMIKKLELGLESQKELMAYCKEIGIGFLTSPFDSEGIIELDKLGLDFMKVPSGEVTNLLYLRALKDVSCPIILSTGMCSLAEVREALFTLERDDVTVLHCNTEYPTPMKDVNLKAMQTMKEEFDLEVGYSDHTLGIEIPIAAVALGARVIEKHFTLDKNMEGPDHRASLNPLELKSMVSAIRNIEISLGSEVKEPSESELKNIKIARKSIVASRDIEEGESFSIENITVKRPGNGISPMMWDQVLDRKANKAFKEDELIQL